MAVTRKNKYKYTDNGKDVYIHSEWKKGTQLTILLDGKMARKLYGVLKRHYSTSK